MEMASLITALLWLIVANFGAMMPSKDHHWRFAYVLMAAGAPIAVWLFFVHGVWLTLGFLVAAGSVLRWPLIYAWRRLRSGQGQ
ncbi:MAG: DUF2484 family protein [Pseudomonadota bacterium]